MLSASVLLAAVPAARASDFGITGLIDTPTARMRNEGELTLSYASQKIVDIYAITYQPTDWLETSFRYSIFNPYDEPGSRDDLKDRSFEAKLRLFREDPHGLMPALAVGSRDLLGTGVWSSEYLVASKRIGPLDLSLGMGWGRFADRDVARNPFTYLGESFETRDAETGRGGEFSVDNYFAGKRVGAFGGARYSIDRFNLDLVAEYNSDEYRRETRLGSIDEVDPWSFGVEWEPYDDLVVSASWQQGDQFALRITASLDTMGATARKAPNGFGARGTEPAKSRRLPAATSWYRRLTIEGQDSGVLIRSAHRLDDSTLNIVYSNHAYEYEADAIQRVLALVEQYAPRETGRVIATGQTAEVATHSISYQRDGQAAWARRVELPDDARDVVVIPPLRVDDPEFESRFRYPNGVLNFNLGARTYLFDPDDPLKAQLFARVSADADLGHGFGLSASWVQNIFNEFDEIERASNSILPRVRSDVVRYLQEGESGLDRAMVMKRGQISDEVYYIAFAGILEEMYGGFGGEVLYRPFGSRFAFGANVLAVRQRDFDKRLGFRDYETVTGHLSAYWASPIHDFDVIVHAGRYLAEDWGATLELQKRFANGWSIGAFATLTDVPFDDFGEGSFDKGLVFRIPFNPFSGRNTQSTYKLVMRPIQRDGGQRIESWGTSLWETHRRTQYDHLTENRARMIP